MTAGAGPASRSLLVTYAGHGRSVPHKPASDNSQSPPRHPSAEVIFTCLNVLRLADTCSWKVRGPFAQAAGRRDHQLAITGRFCRVEDLLEPYGPRPPERRGNAESSPIVSTPSAIAA